MKYHRFKHKTHTVIHICEVILNNKTHLFKIVHGQNPQHRGMLGVDMGQIPCHLPHLTDEYNHAKSPLFMLGDKTFTSTCLDFKKTLNT